MRVELSLDAHPIYEMFGAVFGVEDVRFSMPRSRMEFQTVTLETPLPQANLSWKGQSPGHFGRAHRGRHAVRS
ncbi:hypothetical protein ACFRAQ_10170 [Nocardia sp. NPDC056611]|uniref:hypothetical protein n=1 Tax=Nocardia sp. NPDC056611 TaxID=3345877 RepID=UPI00366D5408